MNTDDLVSGCFNMSGHWGFISGTANTVLTVLDLKKITINQVKDIEYQETMKQYYVYIHR